MISLGAFILCAAADGRLIKATRDLLELTGMNDALRDSELEIAKPLSRLVYVRAQDLVELISA